MIILLLGFFGSGRTSIGTCLAKKLSMEFIEMDEMILKQTRYTHIRDLYEKSPDLWKTATSSVCEILSRQNNVVIAASGDLVENTENIEFFRKNSKKIYTIYLATQPEVLTERLTSLYSSFRKQGTQTVLRNMKKYFHQRDTLYRSQADITVITDKEIPIDVCNKILSQIKE